jgi:hypothetical protein
VRLQFRVPPKSYGIQLNEVSKVYS